MKMSVIVALILFCMASLRPAIVNVSYLKRKSHNVILYGDVAVASPATEEQLEALGEVVSKNPYRAKLIVEQAVPRNISQRKEFDSIVSEIGDTTEFNQQLLVRLCDSVDTRFDDCIFVPVLGGFCGRGLLALLEQGDNSGKQVFRFITALNGYFTKSFVLKKQAEICCSIVHLLSHCRFDSDDFRSWLQKSLPKLRSFRSIVDHCLIEHHGDDGLCLECAYSLYNRSSEHDLFGHGLTDSLGDISSLARIFYWLNHNSNVFVVAGVSTCEKIKEFCVHSGFETVLECGVSSSELIEEWKNLGESGLKEVVARCSVSKELVAGFKNYQKLFKELNKN